MSKSNKTGWMTFRTTSALEEYRLVVADSSGLLSYAGAGAENPIGTLEEGTQADTDGVSATVRTLNAPGSCFMVASVAISRNDPLYPAANGKVTNVPQGKVVGMANQAATADGDIIEVITNVCYPPGTILYVGTAASSALSNTTTETSFGATFSFPANTLRVGDVVKVTTQGIATATNSTDTLTVKVKVNSTVLFTTGAVDVANNDVWYISGEFAVRTIGASGTIVGAGLVGLGAEGTVTGKVDILASTTLDTTAAVVIDVTGTWSVASASNSCRQDFITIRKG